MDNEFILFDRVEKIKSVISTYGETNFYLSFSGGKDSTVLSWLIDYAIPGNKIKRVYVDTGLELNMIKDFVKKKQKEDERIIIIQPSKNVKKTLEEKGYPFKSKAHSDFVHRFQTRGKLKSVKQYLGERPDGKEPWSSFKSCPAILKYQFEEGVNIKISDSCCKEMKEEPINNWAKENNISYSIVGIMASEGGRRTGAKCLAFRSGKLKAFQPLAPITKDFEDWLIKEKSIEICPIYYHPYNFTRTGCKGCPFAINLQEELDVLEKYFPTERKQAEYIWKPVYDEYRRIGYRLK